MLEDVVLEKLRKLAMLKYDGFPEAVRDYETHTHYFLFIWNVEVLETEHNWRMLKQTTLDMWFEGRFEMKGKITFEDIYNKDEDESEKKCARCQGEEGEYVPPPSEGKTTYIR
jgi:hypothetical protein